VFLNVWNIKLPWAEYVVDEQWKVYDVKCKVYTKIKGKKICWPLNWTTFGNMGEGGRALTTIPRVCSVGGYMNKDPIHIMKDCM
jgi:hypothetical protein